MFKKLSFRFLACFFVLSWVGGSSEGQDLIQDQFSEGDTMVIEPAPFVQAETRYDYVPEVPDEVIRERLKSIQSTIKLTYNDKVSGFINYFSVRNRDYMRMVIQRKNLYFPLFEKYLKKHGMPDELKYLAIVESGLNPRAGSRVGAVGLWQFMPGTGKLFKLEQDLFIDERMDPEKSTEAACLYLKELYGIYKDWGLALASYNCGPGTLRRALRKSGYKGDFWAVYNKLPRETRSYFPQFIAVMYTMNFATEHNLDIDSLDHPMEADTVLLSNFVNLETFASLSNICLEDITKLNPELKRNAIPSYARNYPLRIPAFQKEYFTQNRQAILDSASSLKGNMTELLASAQLPQVKSFTKTKVVHKVRSGEVLGSIARKHHVTVASLKTWNSLRGNTIRAGQKLVIWKNTSGSSNAVAAAKPKPGTPAAKTGSKAIASSKTTVKKPASKVYVVQPGDTLWIITRKSGLTVEQLKKLNNLKTNNIKPGQKLLIG